MTHFGVPDVAYLRFVAWPSGYWGTLSANHFGGFLTYRTDNLA